MWDWRYPINDLRDEVRKARSSGENTTTLDEIERLLDDLTSMYERLESEDEASTKAGGTELHDFIQKHKEVVRNTYEHAKQYSNLIIFGGYAGLFAVWNFTKDNLSDWQVWTTGLFALASIFIFIVFELYGTWLRSTQVINQMKELEKAEELNKFPEEYGRAERMRIDRFVAIWPYFFFSAVACALIAALILLYSFISALVCNYA